MNLDQVHGAPDATCPVGDGLYQMKAPYRRPLVLVAPKTLLRHAQAVSTLDEMVFDIIQCAAYGLTALLTPDCINNLAG